MNRRTFFRRAAAGLLAGAAMVYCPRVLERVEPERRITIDWDHGTVVVHPNIVKRFNITVESLAVDYNGKGTISSSGWIRVDY